MTSSTLLSLRYGFLDLAKLAAHFPGDLFFEVQPDDDHSLHLPVAVLADGSEAYSDNVAIVGHLSDEICVSVRGSFVEHDDRGLRISKLSDDGHQFSLSAEEAER